MKRLLPNFAEIFAKDRNTPVATEENWITATPDESQKKMDIVERYGLDEFISMCRKSGIHQFNIIGSAASSLIDPGGPGDPEDVDIYFTCTEDLNKFLKDWEEKVDMHKDHFQIMGNNKYIQVATNEMFHDDCRNIMEIFDFTICMACIEVRLNKKDPQYKFVFHEDTMEDLQDKVLMIHSLPNPEKSCYRMAKYIARGYIIDFEDAKLLVSSVKRERAYKQASEEEVASLTVEE
jgi:hypothetical protein